MPTWKGAVSFYHDYKKLTAAEKSLWAKAVKHFVEDLRKGQFRKGLRVKKMQGQGAVWEMTWAPDGRATFEYGESVQEGEPHIIWRRIGGHEIFDRP
jgi:hypothetical protein